MGRGRHADPVFALRDNKYIFQFTLVYGKSEGLSNTMNEGSRPAISQCFAKLLPHKNGQSILRVPDGITIVRR
ncbi:hypothetical protein D3C73_844520 [compost metagenome]